MTTAQAATQLQVDASTIGKYIRKGLRRRWPKGETKAIYLDATFHPPPRGYDITLTDVRAFRLERKRRGW